MDPCGATIVSNTAKPFARFSSYGNGNMTGGYYDAEDDFNQQLSNFKATAAALSTANRKRPMASYPSYAPSEPEFKQPWPSASGGQQSNSWKQAEPADWSQASEWTPVESGDWSQAAGDWSQAAPGGNKKTWDSQQTSARGYAGMSSSNTGFEDMSSWTNNSGYSSFESGEQQPKRRTIFPTDELADLSKLVDTEPPIPYGATHDIFSPYYGIVTLHQDTRETSEETTTGQDEEVPDKSGLSFVSQPSINIMENAAGEYQQSAHSELFDDLNNLMRDAERIAGVKPEAEKEYAVSDETLKLVQEIEITVPSELMSPETCQLCTATFTNAIMAQSHYEGKKHALRENQYIKKIYEEKGINVTRFLNKPAQKKKPAAVTEKKSDTKLKRFRYTCNLCSMCFESRMTVDLHITNVSHRRKVFDEQTELLTLQNNFLKVSRGAGNSKRGRGRGGGGGSWAGYQDGDYQFGGNAGGNYWGNDDDADYSGNYRAGRGGAGGGGGGTYRGGRGVYYAAERGRRGMYAGGSTWNNSSGGGRGGAAAAAKVAPKAQEVGEYFCALCDKVMNARPQYEAHLASKKHKAKTERMNEEY